MERLQTFGLVREIDVEHRRVRVVVSTGDVARDNAVIDQSGWNFANYDLNPVVLWAHDDRSLPIAKAIPSERQVTANELIETHEFAAHPAAEEVWNAVRGGFVSATSVRWLPGETTMRKVGDRNVLVVTKGHELLESSYVPIPADPGCLVVRADGSRLGMKEHRGRMVIDYSMNCSVRDCPNDGWDGTVDVCEFHLHYLQSGDAPLPSNDAPAAAKAQAESALRATRAAALAENIRATSRLLKEGAA